MALEIGKNGEKYMAVLPYLCPGKNYERTPRGANKYSNKYPDDDNRPYRITKSCFDNGRTKRALTICDTAEYYNMTSDVADVDYLEMFDSIRTRSSSQPDYNYGN